MNSFNANISFCSVFDHLLGWLRTSAPEGANEVSDMLRRIGEAVLDWIANTLGEPTWCCKELRGGNSMSVWSDEMLSHTSFHIPLMRFFSHSIIESTRSPCLSPVLSQLVSSLSNTKESKSLGLIELPLSVLVMAAQVRVGMWKRNGHIMVC